MNGHPVPKGMNVRNSNKVRMGVAESEIRSLFRHKMAWWGLFIVSLFAVWFGGWFVLANYAENRVEEATIKLRQDGVEVDCGRRSVNGFPFRMGLSCDQVNIAQEQDDLQIKTGALRTTSILYDPAKFIAELDGPLQMSAGGQSLSANWDLMRLFADAELDGGFDIVSLNYENLIAASDAVNLKIAQGAIHLRPSPGAPQSLDVATQAVKFSASLPDGITIPDASLSSDLTVIDGHQRLIVERQNFKTMLNTGMQLDIRSIALETGDGGKIVFSGPLEVRPNGALDGTIRLGLASPHALGKWAAQINPEMSQAVAFAQQAMAGMGKVSTVGGQKMKTVELRIDNGTVRLGFIKVGKIPRLK